MSNVFLNKEFAFTPKDFEQVRQRLYTLTGISLADSKDSMVYSRLVRRLRELKLRTFAEYLGLLDRRAEEVEHFINALTTNLTSFFRESHHFSILRQYLEKHQRPCTIWCAASSTGEEPYSIAMTAVQAFGRYDPPVKIIASDIDSQVLATAKKGVYPIRVLDNVDTDIKKEFFFKGKGSHVGKVKVIPALQSLVEFRKVNLLDNKWQIPDELDIIFCRNVMIYFDKSTQIKIVEKMVNKMHKNGLYFAGHSENFSHLTQYLKSLGKTVYQPVGKS